MTKTAFFASILLAAAVRIPAYAGAVTINFDNVATGTIASNALVGWGIDSVTSSAGSIAAFIYDANDCPACGYVLPAGTHKFFATAGGGFPTPTGIFNTIMIFHDPTAYVSFQKPGFTIPTVGLAGWQAIAYDAADNIVDTEGVGFAGGLDYPPASTPTLYNLSGSAGIVKVIFQTNYNYQSSTGSFQFSNLSYETTPEPGTIVIGALGVALIGAFHRRRRADL